MVGTDLVVPYVVRRDEGGFHFLPEPSPGDVPQNRFRETKKILHRRVRGHQRAVADGRVVVAQAYR
jgi:hypothetical protein